MRYSLLAVSLVFLTAPAFAQDGDFCVDRPGLGTPACTIGRGQAMVEVGLLGWDHLADGATVENDLTYGDLLLRVGLDDKTEIQLGIGGYTSARSRDRLSGAVTRIRGIGDAVFGVRHSLTGPGGPIALQALRHVAHRAQWNRRGRLGCGCAAADRTSVSCGVRTGPDA